MQYNVFKNDHWKKGKKEKLLGYGGTGWQILKTNKSYNQAKVLMQNAVQQYDKMIDTPTKKLLFGYTIQAKEVGYVALEVDCFVTSGVVKHLRLDCTNWVKPYPQPILWLVRLPKDTVQCMFRLVIRKSQECQFFAPKLYFV